MSLRRYNVHLDTKVICKLRRMAKRGKIRVSAVIRQALEHWTRATNGR